MPLIDDIETLARLRRDGRLSADEFAAARAAILAEVPDAEPAGRTARTDARIALGLRCVVPPVAAGIAVFAMGIPAELALTLGVTLLAAILVHRFRETES